VLELLDIGNFNFAHPYLLWLLLLLPILVIYRSIKKTKKSSPLILSSLEGLPKKNGQGKARFLPVLFGLRLLSIGCIIVALARPQTYNVNETVNSEGIDIALSIDISGSMLAQDLKPNRIEATKKVAQEFVNARLTDRIGLVIFSGESFTLAPLTTDKNILLQQLKNTQVGQLKDGTAIGMGLGTAVSRMRESQAKSKIVILLTDGENNVSEPIGPVTALEIAKTYQVKVYTIGVGTIGKALAPDQDPFGNIVMVEKEVKIDEPLLKKIASETGGKYFRATNTNALRQIYQEIDKLERTEVDIDSFRRYSEKFFPWALLGILFLFLEILLRYTWLRSFS
jgi:Ca-activated chloride channel family protein